MKLLGRDIPVRQLVERIEARLQQRGLADPAPERPIDLDGPEPKVDPLSFNLGALEENADPTRWLPLVTHRSGAGRLVLVAKWAFRKGCQVFVNDVFARQRLFNGHVLDAYAQLSAEVLRLRREVERLSKRQSPRGAPRRRQAER
jgi:hypothetical protein